MKIKPINIQLPAEIQNLTEGSLFDNDGLISDDKLSKYLAYNPEVIRIYGLAQVDLKKTKGDIELAIKRKEMELERIRAEIILKLDPGIYKNDSLREAKVVMDERYQEIQNEILDMNQDLIDLNRELDELSEKYWKHKSMQGSLDSMTKIRLSERKY